MRSSALAITTLTLLVAFAHPASAHDPAEFDRLMAPPVHMAIPSTCAELADPTHFYTDEKIPEVKKLKASCDAEAAARKGRKSTDESAADSKPKSKDDE